MSSNSAQNTAPSKAVNISNISPATPTFHSTALSDSSQRRTGGSGSFGSGSSSRNAPTPRNLQGRKSQHNRQKKPKLLDDDEYSESAVMRSANSRKGQQSITHLMNFSLPPRPQNQPLRNPRRYNAWSAGSGYHAVDKSRYVHANYRFIVTPDHNYHAQAANADVHLDWASVLQVLVSALTQEASCPICLCTPTAPRMARCGHIFCLPCLIRYMHSSDEDSIVPEKKARWKKCPICWDSIYSSETRPVRWFRGQEGDLPVEGGDVVLRLVRRETKSTLALPRDGGEILGSEEDIPWFHVAEVADYARIMKGGQDYMTEQFNAEIEDLRRQEVEDELLFGDENTWTRKAIGAITAAKDNLKGIGNPTDVPQHMSITGVRETTAFPDAETSAADSSERETTSPIILSHEVVPESGTDASNPLAESFSSPAAIDEVDHLSEAMGKVEVNPESNTRSQRRGKSKATEVSQLSDQPYYFYQALPQFYLSSLDIRILKTAFKEYALFPATILPRVEHISTGHIVDDELRKHVKYLGHLPHGCEVNFLECDWRDVVVPEVLEQFRTEINRRRKRNRDKEAREEKDRIRAEKEEEDKRWQAARRRRPSIGDVSEAPFNAQDFLPLASQAELSIYNPEASSASPPRPSSQFGALASPSTSPPGVRTVWGTTAVSSTSPTLKPYFTRDDGWRQDWEDELLAQQESELIALAAPESQSSGPSTGNNKKKKKNKTKITLMSTNSHRGA
ncbi:hypothetical protein N7495_004547 [Penicillium taxi]|uniref:uncharacterized protein n=1 Tax=Penicillium taxi TaxID=168475 RepID=UPI0025452DE1|nr:uncharacterized protein N7495_004547 [Penicillium taxi]KAJ5899803.1 hypothetical protein N7495_004547 [Penicillium taxi]